MRGRLEYQWEIDSEIRETHHIVADEKKCDTDEKGDDGSFHVVSLCGYPKRLS